MSSPEEVRSRPASRRSSRRNSLKKEASLEERATVSAVSSPKRTQKPGTSVDFMVTGKQITKRCDRANSLPGGYHRRPSTATDISNPRARKIDSKRVTTLSSRSQETSLEDDMSLDLSQLVLLSGGYRWRQSTATDISNPRARKIDSKRVTTLSSLSQETSLEDDMSLDLSQVSDFEDTNSKYGIKQKPVPLATSTPKPRPGPKPRSASLQSHISHMQKIEKRTQMSLDGGKSRDSTFSCSRDSLYKTTSSSASPYSEKPVHLATSTSKPRPGLKPRSASLQSHISHMQKIEKRTQMSLDGGKSRDSTFSCSRDSLYKTTSSSASPYRYGTELDYSSVSPEYSGQSSVDLSPRAPTTDLAVSPRSHNISSCCVSSWQDGTEAERTRREAPGEWSDFWANYNNSLSKVPMKSYYDQCPTPYRTENIDLNDFDLSVDGSRKRSPDNIKNLHNIIRNEGLQLTPRETQNIIKCAHILGNVLSKAIERRTLENENTKVEEIITSSGNTEKVTEVDLKKKNLTLDLKETVLPVEVKEEKRSETVTVQTDISLPNTKSAPIIFERILKQLSKSSIDEADEDDDVFDVKEKK